MVLVFRLMAEICKYCHFPLHTIVLSVKKRHHDMSSLDVTFQPESLIYRTQRLISAQTYMQTHKHAKLKIK